MKKDSSPQSNFFFFNRAWPQAQRRRNKHILRQQGSCWAWSFIEKNPIRRRSCVEHSGLGLETPAINIWAEFPVQWQYKWCWTPLADMPGLARACQTENSHKDLYAASQITLEMPELSQCGVDFYSSSAKFNRQRQESFPSWDTHTPIKGTIPKQKLPITPSCAYNMENTSCMLNF